ncbi:unnamed protein product [marine sediment metagenome]|uniref:Uncharacterized protein n=1 Tax=marine sediment metagenome TaxID=412755 RepID=X1IRZ2_9ZZZZ
MFEPKTIDEIFEKHKEWYPEDTNIIESIEQEVRIYFENKHIVLDRKLNKSGTRKDKLFTINNFLLEIMPSIKSKGKVMISKR